MQNVEADLKDESSGLALQLTGKLMEINQDDLSLQVDAISTYLPIPRPSLALLGLLSPSTACLSPSRRRSTTRTV